MSNFKFDPKYHRYYLNGKQLTGVTTIVGIADFGKTDALIPWAVNCAVDKLKSILKTGSISDKDLEDSRVAWRDKRDKAGDIGTVVHAIAEDYVKSKINKTDFDFYRSFATHTENINIDNEEVKLIKPMFEQFAEWAEEENIEFLLSEQKLYSEKHWYAGTVDLVFRKGGQIYLGDIKTAFNIKQENYIQMGGYDIMLEELGKIKDCAGYCVINIPKILKKNGRGIRRIKYLKDPENHRNAFLACLHLYRYKGKGIKNVVKI